MSFITDRAARGVVLKHGRQAGVLRGAGGARPLAGYFPEDTNPLALDLLARMVRVPNCFACSSNDLFCQPFF